MDSAIEPKRDYYEVLGVTRTATENEIKEAFLKIAGEYHAAGKPANIEAVERFRRIARAYHVLIDAEQRRRYDKFGESGLFDQPIATGYDNLDQLERRAKFGGYYQWPYCDPALAKFLDRLLGLD
jgi:curved DNA-binding protein CbpA